MKIIDAVAERKTNQYVLVLWGSNPPMRDKIYSVYRGVNDADHMKLVARGTATSFLDTNAEILNNDLAVYEIITEHGNKTISSGIIKINSVGDNHLLGVAAEYLWQLNTVKQGVKSYAYCKSDYGSKCPECYDEILKKRIKDICSTCDGSGIITGFKGPVELYVSYGNRKSETRFVDTIEKTYTILTAWTGNIPILKRGDIVIRSYMERYVVDEIPEYIKLVSQKNGEQFVVKQNIILKKLEKPNMVFNLDIQNG